MIQQLLGGENAYSKAAKAGGTKEAVEKKFSENIAVDPVVLRGWAMMDFYAEPEDSPIVPLFVEFNFIGRR